ncbi:hypothetical protein PSACC_02178 [Paramicrosporidium saccamoebae]|uniref:Uncharacterized protein n=1 Tax=Paramicrosporidium saccamoebae TaxID=1246581 RepID=A0A2H9TJV5_9FUNG|nr:hypothetical protein PSACC_02178 [Paramicrosporidium saccamoebae]
MPPRPMSSKTLPARDVGRTPRATPSKTTPARKQRTDPLISDCSAIELAKGATVPSRNGGIARNPLLPKDFGFAAAEAAVCAAGPGSSHGFYQHPMV